MSILHTLAALAAATASLAAHAQPKASPVDPADAGAAVPPISYQSAFKNYQPAKDAAETPDKIWRTTNDEMGRLGGHAGHMTGSAQAEPRTAQDHVPASGGHH